MEKKVLYFEGAGWDGANKDYNGLNCRIRTAFHDKDGNMFYLEIHGAKPNKFQIKRAKEEKIILPSTYLYVEEVKIIMNACEDHMDGVSNERKTQQRHIFKKISQSKMEKTPYTLRNIKNYINSYFNVKFEEVVILDDLAGYRVFSDRDDRYKKASNLYNFGDEFVYDEELTQKRILKVKELKKHFCELFHQEYDNTSYWIEDGTLMAQLNVAEEKRIKAGYKTRQFKVEV